MFTEGNFWIGLMSFMIIAIAATSISKYFAKAKLPLITGLLLTGMVAGPYVFKMIPENAIQKLGFLFDFSLAFIAFSAGSHLYLKELKDSMNSIKWNTISQMTVTFVVSGVSVFFLTAYIDSIAELPMLTRLAISILMATIFIARSPSSAIAILNEMRAKGPFVNTALGVTVIKDVLVVIFFAINFSIAGSLIKGESFDFLLIILIIFELLVSVGLAWVLAKQIVFVLSVELNESIKTAIILFMGFGVYLITHFISDTGLSYQMDLHIEPLLINILASFYVTNYSKHRAEFQDILHKNGPWIYAIFFTLTGASLSLNVFANVLPIVLILFVVRILSLIGASYIGGWLARDKPLFIKLGWMPYITQAGVGIGFATAIASEYPGWGMEIYTIVVAVIVISQVVGPPLFKYAILRVGEAHLRAPLHEFDGIRDVIIFGLEDQSLAIGRQLIDVGWEVKIAALKRDFNAEDYSDIDIIKIDKIDLECLKMLEADKAEAALLLLSDEENLKINELLFEHFGTRDVVVRLHDRSYHEKFNELKAIVVDPTMAIGNLLMQFVRSPHSASLLLGMEKDLETLDVTLRDPKMHGKLLRDIRLPDDIIILSIERKDQLIVSHGYTELKLGDIITMIGSKESLEIMAIECDS